ncbi:MAG: hypothetical protein GF320_06550, partial [Armatimonadia bacterium]|nr:hypothetical protein [Armatimonadia bacterium]
MTDTPGRSHGHTFVPGLELSRLFYQQEVRSILDHAYPDLVHSAGLLGPGSEVLGLDTEMSMDHGWGPRLLLFLSEAEHEEHAGTLNAILEDRLPSEFMGLSIR